MRRYCCPRTYFYPRPPRGGRLGVIGQYGHRLIFLSTPSARRATFCPYSTLAALRNFYPRPPRGGRRGAGAGRHAGGAISIHALREEGDMGLLYHAMPRRYFYPRPPRGGRPQWASTSSKTGRFLSTPSARRATVLCQSTANIQTFLSTPSARRATGCHDHCERYAEFLSTPSARRATQSETTDCEFYMNFYPRPPRGGRPSGFPNICGAEGISIHALREEGDRIAGVVPVNAELFLSTPSARRATGSSDRSCPSACYFYPRPPRGGRPYAGCTSGL